MFAALGVSYQLLPVPPGCFDETVRALGAAGFGGANVTIPHKEAALGLADDPTERATAIGAANTLTFADGAVAADNTDAPGFIRSLPRSPAGATALILGAGGSARAVAWALRDAGAAEVRIWNRTPRRAEELAGEMGLEAVREGGPADLLINCTAVGLGGGSAERSGDLKLLPVAADDLDEYACVVDLVYRPGGTDLELAARERGIPTVDGLEVLVQQGALSYEIWTGRAPDRAAMRRAAQNFDAPTIPSSGRR